MNRFWNNSNPPWLCCTFRWCVTHKTGLQFNVKLTHSIISSFWFCFSTLYLCHALFRKNIEIYCHLMTIIHFYFMFSDRLLKCLWKLYLIFSLWKLSKYNFILLEILLFIKPSCVPQIYFRTLKCHFNTTYHLMINDTAVLSCVLTK